MRIPAAVLLCSAVLLGAPVQGKDRLGYYITPGEMAQVYGTYPLSNGDVLKITREHRRYWAEMKHTGRMEIVPVGSIVFVEKDGHLRFTFESLPFTTAVRVDGVDEQSGTALSSAYGQSGSSGIERKFSE